jgi:cystathionine beta-lyase
MLPGSPGHEHWQRDFTGGCGLFSFVLKGGTAKARDALIDALALFGIGYSFGGFESLATPVDPAAIRTASPGRAPTWTRPTASACAWRSVWKIPPT